MSYPHPLPPTSLSKKGSSHVLPSSAPALSKVYWRQALNASKYGATFLEWAPKNLQASLLVRPQDADWAEYAGTPYIERAS